MHVHADCCDDLIRLGAALPAGCAVVVTADLRADARSVDALARLALTARRRSCDLRVVVVDDELARLVELAGLTEVLGDRAQPRDPPPGR